MTSAPATNTAYFATQMLLKCSQFGAVVVAQLVEQSPLTPEIRGSIPFIGKLLSNLVSCQLCWKEENNEKRGREWPIFEVQPVRCAKWVCTPANLHHQYEKFLVPNNIHLNTHRLPIIMHPNVGVVTYYSSWATQNGFLQHWSLDVTDFIL